MILPLLLILLAVSTAVIVALCVRSERLFKAAIAAQNLALVSQEQVIVDLAARLRRYEPGFSLVELHDHS